MCVPNASISDFRIRIWFELGKCAENSMGKRILCPSMKQMPRTIPMKNNFNYQSIYRAEYFAVSFFFRKHISTLIDAWRLTESFAVFVATTDIDTLRLFKCKQLRYVWDERTSEFVKLKGLDANVPATLLHQLKGLDVHTQRSRQLVYGLNEIFIPLKSVLTILFLEVLNPYYVFQVFSVCLWFAYDYYYYAVVIVLMSVFGITMSIIQTRKNQRALYKTVMSHETAVVVRADGKSETIDTKYLVPGDILEIPSNGCTMQCDAVLLSGNCILDESMLTGESVPVSVTNQHHHQQHSLFPFARV